jgi:hypothetical protein
MLSLLVLVSAVDLDGDPLTRNVPDTVLVDIGTAVHDAPDSTAERRADAPAASRRWPRRIVQYVRSVTRWTLLFRRCHRYAGNDVPI